MNRIGQAAHRHKWLVLINMGWRLWCRRCQTCGKVETRAYEMHEVT